MWFLAACRHEPEPPVETDADTDADADTDTDTDADTDLVGTTVQIRAHDPESGALLPFDDAIDRISARGAHRYDRAGWRHDALVRPDLTLVVNAPLVPVEGATFGFEVPEPGVELALPWFVPGRGWELWTVAPAGSVVELELEVARGLAARFPAAAGAHPAGDGPVAQGLAAGAAASLAQAEAEPDEAARARAAVDAVEGWSDAWEELLAGDADPTGAWWGVTLDGAGDDRHDVDASVGALYGADGWARLVATEHLAPEDAEPEIRRLQAQGTRVLVQLMDSSGMAALTDAAYEARVAATVGALGDTVEAYEVGNEINGPWVPRDRDDPWAVGARVTATLDQVEQGAPGALTVLTLFWTGGADPAPYAMFDWVDQVLAPTDRDRIDVVALSLYVEDDPLGMPAFDRVMTELGRRFPRAEIALGELDYFSADTSRVWAWGDLDDPEGAGRIRVFEAYTAASLAFGPGGGFWWYYETEAYPGWPTNPLWQVMADAHGG